MNALIVIPARYNSQRLPGKPLLLVNGKPLLWWVWKNARRVGIPVVVATDDERIRKTATDFGARVVLTSRRHRSGTERVAEVARKILAKIIVNWQGDEPLLSPKLVNHLIKYLARHPREILVTAARKIFEPAVINDPAVVKVVLDKNNYALYFSRAAIPFKRDRKARPIYWKHLGVYVYRNQFLQKLLKTAPTQLEQIEKLEQLRVLENGWRIKVLPTGYDSIGVDTMDDFRQVCRLLR